MAIEIGFISVVLLKDALRGMHSEPRRVARELFFWKPEWFREDLHLMATSFMAPLNTRDFGDALQARTGLVRGEDWVVVDMFSGPCFNVPWLEHRGGGTQVMGAWKAGEDVGDLARVPCLIPDGMHNVSNWFYRDSIRDEGSHKDDFGSIIPVWGGVNLWQYAERPGPGQDQELSKLSWVSLDTSGIDFMTM